MWRYVIPVVVFAILSIFLGRGLFLNPSEIESALIGSPAPEFDLPHLLKPDSRVRSADFSGQYFLLNVWGSWCDQCYHEHGFLMELASAGVPIVGLNWHEEDREKALEFIDSMGNPYVAIAEDAVGNVAIDWGVYGAPETFLIDREGTVRHRHTSVLTPAVWSQSFLPLIEELHVGR